MFFLTEVVVILFGLCTSVYCTDDQVNNSSGTKFVVGFFPGSYVDHLIVTTNEAEVVDFEVTIGNNNASQYHVDNKHPARVYFNDMDIFIVSDQQRDKTILVQSGKGKLISVFTQIGYAAISCDSMTVNSDFHIYKYMIPSVDFLVMTCEDNTTVSLTPPFIISTESVDYFEESQFGTQQQPSSFLIDYNSRLLKGRKSFFIPYTYRSSTLYGTVISSNNPVVVVSGLGPQIPPHTTWGTTFILPLMNYPGEIQYGALYDYTEVTIVCDSTSQTIDHQQTLNAGDYGYHYQKVKFCSLHSSKPVTIALFHGLHIIPPITQYLRGYQILPSFSGDVNRSRNIIVVVPVEDFKPENILLDDYPLEPNSSAWHSIYCTTKLVLCGYSNTKIIDNRLHNLSHVGRMFVYMYRNTSAVIVGMGLEAVSGPVIGCAVADVCFEKDTNLTVTCTRYPDQGADSTVMISIIEHTAKDKSDYFLLQDSQGITVTSNNSISLNFRGEPFYDSVRSFDIQIIADRNGTEIEETFFISISTVTNSIVISSIVQVNICQAFPQNNTPITDDFLMVMIAALIPSVTGVIAVISILIITLCTLYRKGRKKRNLIHIEQFATSASQPESDYIIMDEPQRRMFSHELQNLLKDKRMLYSKDQLQLSRMIGQGQAGVVYKGYLKTTVGNELIAVKTSKALFSNTKHIKNLAKEVSIMLSFEHPNIMSLIGVCLQGNHPLIIMPFMLNGCLLDFIRNNQQEFLCAKAASSQIASTKKTLLSFCHQIAKGMEYLVQKDFIHRDLAARNCMIDRHGVVKVADFGLSEDLCGHNYFRRNQSVASEEKVPIRWMAPESIQNDIYTESTDVWSFGVTVWEVFTCGRVPYHGISVVAILKQLQDGERLDKPQNFACTSEVYDLMRMCWSLDPKFRPKFKTLCVEFSNLLEKEAGYLELQAL